MKRIVICLLACLPLICSAAFDLKKEMDRKTYKASGLDKLNKEEMATLNAAVAEMLGIQEQVLREEAELPQGDDGFGLETVKERVETLFQANSPDRIESTIVGEFSGWNGKTRFKLANGQVWQQSRPDTFVVKMRVDPVVIIRRGSFGGYLLKIEGYNSSCRVERIK